MTVGLFRVGDRCYAIDDVCPHALAYLSDGFQEGDEVECPLHAARFNVITGKCLGGPTTQDVRTVETKIKGDDVLVRLPAGQ
jgi:nitrite reductase/ring-hydroxylating ferredoxin subunit